MNKIPCLFVRDFGAIDVSICSIVTPGCEWVTAGEGRATRKYDGTACLVQSGVLYKRYDAKHGKLPPPGFVPCGDADDVTGHWPGWLAVGEDPADVWHRKAIELYTATDMWPPPDGTFELCGPKINGNPEGFDKLALVPHGRRVYDNCPRDFAGLEAWLKDQPIEGIVWWHLDGRKAKIRKADFGLAR
jgi:hypothetical protein